MVFVTIIVSAVTSLALLIAERRSNFSPLPLAPVGLLFFLAFALLIGVTGPTANVAKGRYLLTLGLTILGGFVGAFGFFVIDAGLKLWMA